MSNDELSARGANRLLLERIELTKRRDAADEVKRWRYATAEERSKAMLDLAHFGEAVLRSRGFPDVHEPLMVCRLRLLSR